MGSCCFKPSYIDNAGRGIERAKPSHPLTFLLGEAEQEGFIGGYPSTHTSTALSTGLRDQRPQSPRHSLPIAIRIKKTIDYEPITRYIRLMNTYNWQKPDWPNFSYTLSELEEKLFTFGQKTGHLAGILDTIPAEIRQTTIIATMLAEALTTSEIEGEYLSQKEVLSSIHKGLNIPTQATIHPNKKALGVGALMTDLRHTYPIPLTQEKLWEWHRLLMTDEASIPIGTWRTHTEPMRVVSGAIGKTKIHFEAPPSQDVPHEMQRFITWFNNPPQALNTSKNAPIRAAIAHLYFESIHPFEDGNGRIGRAIAEKALAQGIGFPMLLSLSDAIQLNKKNYYDQLEAAQRHNTITLWLHYFVDLVLTAHTRAEQQITFTLKKTLFFDTYQKHLNERQTKVVTRMLAAGTTGFEGGMNAKKYMALTKASKATATRDLQHLLAIGAFQQLGAGGRSTSYGLSLNAKIPPL
jgi:Fic family protein